MSTRPQQSIASPARQPAEPGSRLETILALAILALAALVTLYVRVRLLSVPLERDEGEYAYLAQLILEGRPPFLDAYTLKLPGTPIAYAMFMGIFGQTTEAIHLGLLIVDAATAGLLWLMARRLFDRQTAAASAALFLLLAMSKGVQGVFAHATQFVNLFAMAGLLLILSYEARERKSVALTAGVCFAAGVCFGAAILMKQHAVVLALFAAGLIAWIARSQTRRWSKTIATSAVFALGVALPLALIVLWTLRAGTFHKLWFWTVEYALEYAKGLPLPTGLSLLWLQLARIASPEPLVWILAALGIVVLFLARDRKQKTAPILVIGLLISSFVAMCPGFYFREHYFVLILPAVAMLAGLTITRGVALARAAWSGAPAGAIPAIILFAALGNGYWVERAYLFQRAPNEVSRDVYGPNPFQESVQIGAYLKTNSAASDRIAVLGSEPELYFYASRLAATGHIYMYGLMEDQPYAETMQKEAIAEIEASRPLYLVYVNVPYSWVVNEKSPTRIFQWLDEYANRSYRLTGVVDISRRGSRYVWGEQAASYTPQSANFVTIWRRAGNS